MLHYPLQLTSHLSTTYSSLTKCVFGHVDHLQGWGGHCSLRQPVTILQGFVRNYLLIMRQSVSSWSFCPLVFLFFLFHRVNSWNIWRWISCSLQIISVPSESSLVPPRPCFVWQHCEFLYLHLNTKPLWKYRAREAKNNHSDMAKLPIKKSRNIPYLTTESLELCPLLSCEVTVINVIIATIIEG